MNASIISLIVIFVVVAVAFILRRFKNTPGSALTETPVGKGTYHLKKSLFTPAERSFWGVLESLNYEGVTITCKVRIADFITAKADEDRRGRQSAQNRINAKHVDFLILRRSDGQPLLAVELDDSSHEQPDRQARDAFVDSVLSEAGLPLIHFPVRHAYDPKEVRQKLDALIWGKGNAAVSPTRFSRPVPAIS